MSTQKSPYFPLPDSFTKEILDSIKLIHGDCVTGMQAMQPESIDLVFADPPYFLSNGGTSCSGGKRVKVDKGDWDKPLTPAEMHDFNLKWISECYRLLKVTGSIFVSASFHNLFDVGQCLNEAGFITRNVITWQKTNPPPNLGCRCFKHSTEFIVWAVKDKSKHFFDYDLMKQMNGGTQMTDVWSGSLTPKSEKFLGHHPTQKPLYLLDHIIQAASKPGDVVMDPFCGSGTTGVSAVRHGRKFIGMELSKEYIELSRKRIHSELGLSVEEETILL